MNTAILYGRYVRAYAAGQMEYRLSLLLRLLATLTGSILEYLGIWVLFARFRLLGSWTLTETLLLFAMASISFGLAEMFARGFDKFPAFVASGDFDRMLVRPRSTVLQVLGTRFELSKLGRVLQGTLLAAWCLTQLDRVPDAPQLLLMTAAVISGALVYAGVFILFATLSFWTIQSVELSYILTNLSLEVLQYPIEIYAGWVRRFFTFVVPLACITYYPLLAVLEKPDGTGMPGWFPWAAPGLGPLFLVAALGFWRVGVRHYHSTGS